VCGVEAAVFALGTVEDYGDVFDGVGEVFAFACYVVAVLADRDCDLAKGNKR
jgi:hypothetical protein